MSWMRAASGLVLIVAGSVAAISGTFDRDGSWLLALGLAVVGVVGLVNTAASLAAPGQSAAVD